MLEQKRHLAGILMANPPLVTSSSPCVRMCTLNRADFCLGCKRHLNEIKGWGTMSEAMRQAIMDDLKSRAIPDADD